MRRVSSIKSLSRLAPRAESPVRSPLRSPGHFPFHSPVHPSFQRSKSVASAPSLAKAATEGARAQTLHAHSGDKAHTEDAKQHTADADPAATNALDDLMNHDDLHIGPYGVESPHWSFVYTVTEVTVAVKSPEEVAKEREEIRKREDLEERLRMAEFEGRRDL